MASIFHLKTKTITFSALILGVSTTLSALLGLLRDRLLAGEFGAGEYLDIYFAAFRIPNFVYGILITGGIIAAFLPVFSESYEKNKEEGWSLASNLLNTLLILTSIISTFLLIFAPFIIRLITPGFSAYQREWTIILTRIMLLSPIILGASSFFSGVLQYFGRFFVYALAPILYNLGIIFGIIFLYPLFGLIGLAYGVVLGAILHLLIQLPAGRSIGFKYKRYINLKSERLKRIAYLIVPRILGQSSIQLNMIVVTAIASTLAPGSISIFHFAEHLQAFPVRIIGVSFAIAAFPELSRSWNNKRMDLFLNNFSSTFRQILFLIVPLSLLIFILRAQIVRLVLGTGEFGWVETRLTAASLGIFSFGLFATALIHFLIRVYFSFQDTKTPVVIAIFSMMVNIVLCFLFVFLLGFENIFSQATINLLKLDSLRHIQVVAFPMAFLISGITHFLILFFNLKKKLKEIKEMEIISSFLRILTASFIMAVAAFFSLRVALYFVVLDTFMGVFWQALITTLISVIVYFLSALALGLPEVKKFTKDLLK